ncbi:uncharacterized protein LOC143876332 [Tasmannia lanceolata]|uniref:uncharacterized protein LOC143876332 n=1 Tax=Tasmannia lanceolata TaxID=3420 RepID=UPI004062D82D
MGSHPCTVNGTLDDSKYSNPLPWIGLYIAGASLLCALAMALDTFFGFRRRKLWFPCKFFSLNATSLTLLAIATKLPVDLNTSMPRRQDQLTKLSGTVLICIVMGNFMPSLAAMGDSEMLSNVVALGILVITVIVNVGIQIGTGVIYDFLPEHAAIMFFMLVLLVLIGSSSLAVPTTKELLEQKYEQIYQDHASVEEPYKLEKLNEDVNKFWMMAHTCSPQYVMGRSAPCTASGAFCLLSALILMEAMLRSYIRGSLRFCSGESDYSWSIILILIAQVIAIGVGTIAPAYRWFNVISFRHPDKGIRCSADEFRIESYWVQRLKEWKENPLPYHISRRRCRRIAHSLKNQILDVWIGMQKAVVSMSKGIQLVSVLPVSCFNVFLRFFHCKRLRRKSESIGSISKDSRHESEADYNPNLEKFVLHLEGEDDLVHLIMTHSCKATEQWIHKGTKNQPTYLIDLLKSSSQDFKGVGDFDSNHIPPIGSEEPHNCWALAVVTLTSIAVALPYIDPTIIKPLMRAVSEGLRYVRLIEKNLDVKGLINMRNAADTVWLGIDLHDRWLNEDLHKLAHEQKNPKRIIEKLADVGKNRVLEFTNRDGRGKKTLEWPVEVLAGNSMYRLARTILQDYDDKLGTSDKLFQWLRITIADLLGACLTNLPRVISMECTCNAIEVREASVREATYLLGECKKLLSDLEQKMFSDVDPDCMADFDKWHSIMQATNAPSCSSSASTNIYMSSFTSSSLCLSIETQT